MIRTSKSIPVKNAAVAVFSLVCIFFLLSNAMVMSEIPKKANNRQKHRAAARQVLSQRLQQRRLSVPAHEAHQLPASQAERGEKGPRFLDV